MGIEIGEAMIDIFIKMFSIWWWQLLLKGIWQDVCIIVIFLCKSQKREREGDGDVGDGVKTRGVGFLLTEVDFRDLIEERNVKKDMIT